MNELDYYLVYCLEQIENDVQKFAMIVKATKMSCSVSDKLPNFTIHFTYFGNVLQFEVVRRLYIPVSKQLN